MRFESDPVAGAYTKHVYQVARGRSRRRGWRGSRLWLQLDRLTPLLAMA